MNTTIPQRAIFSERDDWVFYIANWQSRFNNLEPAKLVRLSRRHYFRYRELMANRRSEKTIAYLMFKRFPVRITHNGRPLKKKSNRQVDEGGATTPSIELGMLGPEQLSGLIQRSLHGRFPNLRKLTLAELRNLYIAIQRNKAA